jgi:hypothetical protein
VKHWSEETNWKPLSEVVESLKRKVEAAYYHCDEEEANAAHEDLLCAEWRMRQAERRNRG